MSADLIIRNGKVLTMDEACPRAEAVAMAGNTILAVGTDAEVGSLKGNHTHEIDAGGGTVLPGFIEAHMHLFGGAAELDHLHLDGVRGFEALRAAVRAYADGRPDDDLLIGGQVDYIILGEHEPVTRQHLDRILPDRPFIMYAPDHHTAWANTAALDKAGLLKGRKLGPGNEIVMAADGLAAGELRENEAIDPVQKISRKGLRDRLGLTTGGEPEYGPVGSTAVRSL